MKSAVLTIPGFLKALAAALMIFHTITRVIEENLLYDFGLKINEMISVLGV